MTAKVQGWARKTKGQAAPQPGQVRPSWAPLVINLTPQVYGTFL